MKILLLITLLLLPAVAWADKQESVETLKARAERSQPKDRVELCTEIAERQAEALDKAYEQGNVQEAKAVLADVINYGVEAATLAGDTGKRMKKTEIALRKLSTRLESIRRSLEVEERPAVADAIQRIETARNDLLNRMFRK